MSQLDQITPDLASWIRMTVLHSQEMRHSLTNANLYVAENETPERTAAAATLVGSKTIQELLLLGTKTGETISLADAFRIARNNFHNSTRECCRTKHPST